MVNWESDLTARLDPVESARLTPGFEADARQGGGAAVGGQAAVTELDAAVGKEHGNGDRGAAPGVVPAGLAGAGDGTEGAAGGGVRARGAGVCGAAGRVAARGRTEQVGCAAERFADFGGAVEAVDGARVFERVHADYRRGGAMRRTGLYLAMRSVLAGTCGV